MSLEIRVCFLKALCCQHLIFLHWVSVLQQQQAQLHSFLHNRKSKSTSCGTRWFKHAWWIHQWYVCVCVCARTAGDIIQKHTVATFLGCTRQIWLEWSHSQIEMHAIFYRPSEPANTTSLDRLQASELPPTSLICLASHRIPGVVPTAGFSASCRSSWLIRASCAGLRTDMSAVWPA